MIEGIIAFFIGPFVLFGIIIAAFGLITGARIENLVREYVRFCATIVIHILVPVLKKSSYLVMLFGQKLRYVLAETHKPVDISDFHVHVVPPTMQSADTQATTRSYDAPVDIEEVND